MQQAYSGKDKVLIVGAGPSGLMMAHELQRFGINFRLIDAQLEKPLFSRAIGVQVRTQEIFDALGLLKNLNKYATTLSGIEVYAEGRPPIKVSIACNFSPFKNVLVVDQPYTEAVLEEALMARGVQIERGVALISLKKTQTGFVAELKDLAGELSYEEFSYVVGADGAHSLVRKGMNMPFAGLTYDDAFILADAECFYAKNHHTFKLFFNKQAFLAIIPMAQKNQHRLISIRRNERSKVGPEPTKEEFVRLAREIVPFDFTIGNVKWVSRFFVSCRNAQSYQDGRIFLVGDAAHIHSPAGGQGMNTGLQDAFNLGFKLAFHIKGKATAKLLETYTEERRPVGEFLLKRTDALFRFMVRSSIWARLLRRFMMPIMAKLPSARGRVFRIASQIAIRYKKGCVCQKTGHLSLPDIRVGARIPSFKLTDQGQQETYLHKLFLDLAFVNIIYCPSIDTPNLMKAIKLCSNNMSNIKSIVVFKGSEQAQQLNYEGEYFILDKECRELNKVNNPTYFLVRPDHHVFCLGPLDAYSHAISSLQDYLKESSHEKND